MDFKVTSSRSGQIAIVLIERHNMTGSDKHLRHGGSGYETNSPVQSGFNETERGMVGVFVVSVLNR